MSDVYVDSDDRTLPMTVANTGFMLDRLGRDCDDLQFLRELTQNSIEAIQRGPEPEGQIIWDVDWDTLALTDAYKLCVVDTGVGMTGQEMVEYINQLSSSIHVQSHEGNFGVGAKVAAATRNHEGLIYLSWQDGVGSMIHLWRDPQRAEYGLRQFRKPNGDYDHWVPLEDTVRPQAIGDHGTKVVLQGNSTDEDTMAAPLGAPSPSLWIARYLNTRYFRLPEGITIKAREGWRFPLEDTDRNVLRTLTGQEQYLDAHSESSGTVELSEATARWWILKDDKALGQHSSWIASRGHTAALFQNELYEMEHGRGGVARLQHFGVIFGYRRVVIYVEPRPDDPQIDVTSNTARTALRLRGQPLPWADWATEFRGAMPREIEALVEQVGSGSKRSDHTKAIRDRIRNVRELFKLTRYRPNPEGSSMTADNRAGGGERKRAASEHAEAKKDRIGESGGSGGSGGRGGNVYGLFVADDGTPADKLSSFPEPEVLWLSASDRPGCKPREPGFLEDRAAKYLADQNLLQINADFRGFTDMVDRWKSQYSHVPGASATIEDVVHEWFEQALTEAVLGVHGLSGSREWTADDMGSAFSEEALTVAVMQRYHVDVAVRRALGAKLGSLKVKAS